LLALLQLALYLVLEAGLLAVLLLSVLEEENLFVESADDAILLLLGEVELALVYFELDIDGLL